MRGVLWREAGLGVQGVCAGLGGVRGSGCGCGLGHEEGVCAAEAVMYF